MARLHRLVELDHLGAPGATLERLEVQTISGHEILLLAPLSDNLAVGAVGGHCGRDLLVGDCVLSHGGGGCDGCAVLRGWRCRVRTTESLGKGLPLTGGDTISGGGNIIYPYGVAARPTGLQSISDPGAHEQQLGLCSACPLG